MLGDVTGVDVGTAVYVLVLDGVCVKVAVPEGDVGLVVFEQPKDKTRTITANAQIKAMFFLINYLLFHKHTIIPAFFQLKNNDYAFNCP